MQVHLVDGTYELFRCFYGAPSAEGANGREVGAVRALVGTLLALRRDGATHVGIAFDTVIESFRNLLFDGYKTGAGIDPALWAQFPLAEQAARALGLVTWSMIDFEADDALATMAARVVRDARVERVLLCSPDKDLYQCVDDARVVVLDRMRKKQFGREQVQAKLGVPPELVPDFLALVGDDADGIPGLTGFGAKGAAAVLTRYGAIEQIPDERWDVAARGADKLRSTFFAERERALLFKTLATLRRDVPMAERVDDLEWRTPDPAALASLAREVGEAGLEERVHSAFSPKNNRSQ